MTVYNRPDYTRQTLEHLSKCAGINEYIVSIRCEPGNNEVIELVSDFEIGCQTKFVNINSERKGCTLNVLSALNDGFRLSDYVIMLEDDILFGRDALLYFEWARDEYHADPEVFTVSAYRKIDSLLISKCDKVRRTQWFSPWGWATWRARFSDMSAGWGSVANASWDVTVNHVTRNGRYMIEPEIGRAKNIGALNGTYVPSPEWHAANQLNTLWIESADLKPVSTFLEI